MTEFPTLCVLRYDRDVTEQQRSTTVGLRLPRPRRPRPRSRTHPKEGDGADVVDHGRLEFLARGVHGGGGDEGGKMQLTTPYRYSSSKSSSLQASKDDNLLFPHPTQSSFTTPELQHSHHHQNHHHRSLSEPPPHVIERARTAPTSSLSLPVLRQGGAGETSLTVNAELLQDPKWNEYLNAWVSGKQVSSHAFVSFVGAMSLKDRGRYHYVREFEELPALPCPRFFEHMHHIPVPKALWKEKKKNLKKPEFWTWKGRTSPKVPKPRPVRKRVQLCNSPQTVQTTPPSSVQCLTVDIPTCSIESEESLNSTPTFDLCSLSNPSPSLKGVSPVRSPEEEKSVRWQAHVQVEKSPEPLVLPEIQEFSEPSDYGSIRSGIESLDTEPAFVPVKLHKLENPPRPPSSVDWDKHSYLDDFDDDMGKIDDGDGVRKDDGKDAGKDNMDSPPRLKLKDVTMGPLASSKVDQSSYMYNDHIVALEPVVFDTYLPLDDPSELMRSQTVPGCEESVVDPYPLEDPLQPDVSDVDRTVVHQSSILKRPDLPSPPPPPPKEPTPPPTPPPPKEPTPPPKIPTPPPIQKPQKKPTKPKRPPKKEKTKVVKTVKSPAKQPTPEPEPQPVVAPPKTPTPPPPPEPEPIKIPTPEPVIPPRVIDLPPLPVVSDPEPEESESDKTSEASPSPEPEDSTPEPSATSASSSSPGTPSPPPLPSSPAERDMSLALELERQRLADERHRKALLMYEKLRARQPLPTAKMEEPESFKEIGWLAQFCILKPEKLKMYQMAFETVDENHSGWLSCFDTLIALKGITGTQNLTEKEEEYIYRILEICDYSILDGSDFRIFSIMAGLSQKLASIDMWVRNLIQKFDLQMLDWKIYRGKELFEWCIDEATNRLSISRLMIELRAGGVSDEHLDEVRTKFGADGTLDLIDFLTYLPLFIMTHESVVCNPLSDVRDK